MSRFAHALLVAISEQLAPAPQPDPATAVAVVVHPSQLGTIQTHAPNMPVFTDQACARSQMYPVQYQQAAQFDQLLRQGMGPLQAWRHCKKLTL